MKLDTHDMIKSILDNISTIDHIKTSDIPNIELYMDQVTTFMDSQMASSKRYPEDKILTKTMINNYAKNDLLPPPLKKKYSKEHVLMLIFIYYFKSFLSISDIQALLTPLADKYFQKNNGLNMEDLYNEVFGMEKEQVEVEEKAIRYIAKKADGSMRDALSLLDQCIAFYLGQKLTYDHVLDVLGAVDTEVFSRFLREILSNNVAQVMKQLEELVMQGRELGQFVSDFTCYLRNLLLLKSSEELEDVLDVSSDNLVLLKEEAGMVREDTLIRFIRIFSELSGQMRFSGSKRVLLEVAVIKLCRPQMETDELSLLERIRMLEKKLESGMIALRQAPAGQTAPRPDYGAGDEAFFGGLDLPGAGGNAGADELSFEEKAAPEDLQKIMSMWPSIVAQTTGRFKMTLISAVPKYNAAGDDNRLFVVFSDFMGERYANDPEAKKQLETIISSRLGKEVEVKMVLPDEEHLAPGRLAKINVSEGLSQIHADIEIEEE